MSASRPCVGWFTALLLLSSGASASQLIVNARVADGTGAPLQRVSVRIDADRIVAVGALSAKPDEEVIDAGGQVLAPGFIDTHSHHDLALFEHRDAAAAVSQGITTIVVGQDGLLQFPLPGVLRPSRQRAGQCQRGVLCGSRQAARGSARRRLPSVPATPAEVVRMRALLESELRAGALGLSTGLEYDPGNYSSTSEVIELARESARHGGRYISHTRSEDVRLDEAIDELLQIGREVCLPVQISHFKIAIRTRWGEAPAVLKRLDEARARGIDVTADVYPYEYWQSTLTVLFPQRNFTDRRAAEFALTHLAAPEDLRLSQFEPDPTLVGRTVAQIAQQRRTDAPTALMNLIGEAQSFGKAGGEEMVIARSISDTDIGALIAWPNTNISSDGMLMDRHPRGAGAFPRVLRRYVREQKLLSRTGGAQDERLVGGARRNHRSRRHPRRRVCGSGAARSGEGQRHGDDRPPALLSTGIQRVWVNGETVWLNGQATRAYSGRVIRRSSTAKPYACTGQQTR